MPTYTSEAVTEARKTRPVQRIQTTSRGFVITAVIVLALTFLGLFSVSGTAMWWIAGEGQMDLPLFLRPALLVGLDFGLVATGLAWAVQRSRGESTTLSRLILFSSVGFSVLINIARGVSTFHGGFAGVVAIVVETGVPLLLLAASENALAILVAPASGSVEQRQAIARLADRGLLAGGADRKDAAVQEDLAAAVRELHTAQPKLSRSALAKQTGVSVTFVKNALADSTPTAALPPLEIPGM